MSTHPPLDDDTSLLVPPPNSLLRTPPSRAKNTTTAKASQLREILHFIQLRARGCPSAYTEESEWRTFHLLPADYDILVETLTQKESSSLRDYAVRKLRSDYFSRLHLFVVRMHSFTHEFFSSLITTEIMAQLKEISTRSETSATSAKFANSIDNCGRPTLKLFPGDDGGKDKHEPDAAFWHEEAKWPGVVLEVSYSQKRKALEYLAEEYILGSQGNIQVVVGLDIEYKDSNSATLSVWRAHRRTDNGTKVLECIRQVTDKRILTKEGNPVQSTLDNGLCLYLRDFAAIESTFSDPGAMNDLFHIPLKRLGELFKRTQTRANALKEDRVQAWEPVTEKRRRPRTPKEEIMSSGDEDNDSSDEEPAAKRGTTYDPDYAEDGE